MTYKARVKRPAAVASIVAGLWIAATALPACGSDSAYSKMTAQQIYARRCEHCHGPRGLATSGRANSFVGKRQHWQLESLLEYLENPALYKKKQPHLAKTKRFMPKQVDYIPDEAKRRLAEYVLGLMDAYE